MAVAATAVAVTVIGTPAAACDYAPALTVESVAAAGPGGDVPFFGREVPVLGVQEHTVLARAPAFVPFTSQRSVYARVRTWGQPDGDRDDMAPGPAGVSPYFAGIGDSCGGYETPPRGAAVLNALVDDGIEVNRYTIGPEEYVFHFPDGPSEAQRAALDDAFGPATLYEVGASDRIAAVARVWWPHALTVALVLIPAMAVLLLAWWRRRTVG
jgi:hypothetical protein